MIILTVLLTTFILRIDSRHIQENRHPSISQIRVKRQLFFKESKPIIQKKEDEINEPSTPQEKPKSISFVNFGGDSKESEESSANENPAKHENPTKHSPINFNDKKTNVGDTVSDKSDNSDSTDDKDVKDTSDDRVIEDTDENDDIIDDNVETVTTSQSNDYLEIDEFADTGLTEDESDDEPEEGRLIPFRINTKSKSRRRNNFIFLALGDINEIFGKKKAKNCRKEKKVYHKLNGKCYNFATRGPCKEDEIFLAQRNKLYGVCRKNICKDPSTPFLENGECVDIYGACSPGMRLYYNRFGESVCHCDEGLLLNKQDGSCYREFSAATCSNPGETWRRGRRAKSKTNAPGKCKKTSCAEGEVQWRDGKCYRLDDPAGAAACLDQLALDETAAMIICTSNALGRGLASATVKNCRRGRVWSARRNKCVRGFG